MTPGSPAPSIGLASSSTSPMRGRGGTDLAQHSSERYALLPACRAVVNKLLPGRDHQVRREVMRQVAADQRHAHRVKARRLFWDLLRWWHPCAAALDYPRGPAFSVRMIKLSAVRAPFGKALVAHGCTPLDGEGAAKLLPQYFPGEPSVIGAGEGNRTVDRR